MLDDSKYVIVPHQTELNAGHPVGAPAEASNRQGDYVASLIKEGYRIISKMSNRDSVHYVLIKFKYAPPVKRGEIKPPIEPAIPLEADDDPLSLDDINFQ